MIVFFYLAELYQVVRLRIVHCRIRKRKERRGSDGGVEGKEISSRVSSSGLDLNRPPPEYGRGERTLTRTYADM
jgi:hypothetical protein